MKISVNNDNFESISIYTKTFNYVTIFLTDKVIKESQL